MVRALDLLSGGLELKSPTLPLDRFVGTFNKFLFNLQDLLAVPYSALCYHTEQTRH